MTTKEVMCVVNTLAKKFRADSHVHVFQELRFAYEEEADPAAFFSPFLWRLVVEDVGRARSATPDATMEPREPPVKADAPRTRVCRAGHSYP